MEHLMNIIKNRRSIRHFEEKPISDDMISALLESVRWSPSWANTQCWEVVVVREQAVKEQLAGAVYKGNPAAKSIVAAPVVFVLCAKLQSSGYYKGQVTTKFGDWFMFDSGIACQNLCLCGHAMGLGSVVVGLFDHDKTRTVLGVPDGYEVVCMIPVGWPAKSASAPKRREIAEFSHADRF
ncbi:MAG: nitroreductase family protein [Thermodesulfobacteriota bacterium]